MDCRSKHKPVRRIDCSSGGFEFRRFRISVFSILVLASFLLLISCNDNSQTDQKNKNPIEDVQEKRNANLPEGDMDTLRGALNSDCKSSLDQAFEGRDVAASEDFKTEALRRTHALLDSVLVYKKNQLEDYLMDLQKSARGISRDSVMRKFFMIKKEYYALSKKSNPPPKMVQLIATLKKKIQERYILNYTEFYDILMVADDGEVFYTIRQQEEYHKNLFGPRLKNTTLAKRLAQNANESFVDFQHYEISGEPSAFFVEPIIENGEPQGWIVLQNAVNRINSLFSRHEGIGETGEVILVNKDHYLLTNSRFKPGSSILIQKLADENISEKFKEGKGHKEVIDYRGFPVVSSFEVVDVFNSQWLIIAKMNKGEAMTRMYMQNPDLYQKRWLNNPALLQNPSQNFIDTTHHVKFTEVDMDEFRREDNNSGLYTHGVATCTALLCYWPGKFAYLAHISPYDVIYGENRTDISGHILRQLQRFEVFPYQRPNMRFVISSPRTEAFAPLVNRILEAGYHLSQIHVAASPASVYGNIAWNNAKQKGWITWMPANEKEKPVLLDVDSLPMLDGLI